MARPMRMITTAGHGGRCGDVRSSAPPTRVKEMPSAVKTEVKPATKSSAARRVTGPGFPAAEIGDREP